MSEAYIEINLKVLENNIEKIRDVLSDKTEIMAVVKGNGYGHGAADIAKHLNTMGIFNFAVSSLDEAIFLRKHKIKGEILVFGYTSSDRALEIKKYNITQTIVDLDHAKKLEAKGIDLKCHLKVDTGMNRQGINHEKTRDIMQIFNFKNINIKGIYSHLSASDSLVEENIKFTNKQIGRFDRVIDLVKKKGFNPKTHIQSSYGVLNYNNHPHDFVRIGILMYGSLTSPGDNPRIDLKVEPSLSLKAPISSIKEVKKGDRIGYSNAFIAQRDMTIALIPIGYTDGIDRGLSFKGGQVIINGKRAKMIGRISMDNTIIDITDIKGTSLGELAVLIGRSGLEEITALELAEKGTTITPDVLSSLSNRLDRKYIL